MSLVAFAEPVGTLPSSARRVLDLLDRLDARVEGCYSARRSHVRRTFRGTAKVRLVSSSGDMVRELTVWTRSISEAGLSFLCEERITDRWVLLGLEPSAGRTVWLRADVVRRREVPSKEFWEHGVAFRERVGE